MKKEVTIIGTGPAALMLAVTLDSTRFNVTLYERNFAAGRKFLVAGDGGFNLTHAEHLESLILRYTPSDFIETSLRSFSNLDLQAWLKTIGIDTFVGSSKRIFPIEPIKPIDVLNAFLHEINKKQFSIKTKHTWNGWSPSKELMFEHEGQSIKVKTDITVFALGGASWSVTGSDGKWTHFFTEKGIDIVPFQSSNCAYQVGWNENFISLFEGQALKNIEIRCGDSFKKGEVVLTRFGLEGGAIYALSPEIRKQFHTFKKATVLIDLKPTLSFDEIMRTLNHKGNHTLSSVLQQQLKLNKIQVALLKSILPKEAFTTHEILAKHIKQLPLEIIGMAPIDESISTVGGIALHEVNSDFELNQLPNHFALGEMMDWDAPTGGYLLQACCSMGHYCAMQLNDRYSDC